MRLSLTILLAFASGVVLGLFFFGGLWLTVRALPKVRYPTLLFLTSFWGRTAIVVVGLVFAMAGRWQSAVASLAGFLLARLLCGRWIPRGGAVRRGAE